MGQAYMQSEERPPQLAREFRAAWVATVHNIDWPSQKGLSAAAQQAELRTLLDKLVALKMNAVIFQVRPQCDALYASSIEPWSPSLTGVMGRSPGYDPLAFCIKEAHARGIEVHAWFNPFRALTSTSQQACGNHVTQAEPKLTRRFGSMVWCDPAHDETRARALRVIMDVVNRYDVDGVHLDDYFYPYPAPGVSFADGKSPAQRRAYVDGFVSRMYQSVKNRKPWVRVGISPFGIWRPGVPSGIEAGIDSFEDLAGDSRKWLKNGWVDYLAPQLYWRISPQKQSFPLLLEWWRAQGSRPVWPGIATSRIKSSDDPGRSSSEIIQQIDISRKIQTRSNGHIHWSAKSLVTNRGGISSQLAATYTQPAAVPAMPWVNGDVPNELGASASVNGANTLVSWPEKAAPSKVAVQAKIDGVWKTVKIGPGYAGRVSLPKAQVVAVTAIDRFGNMSEPTVLKLR